MLPLKLYDEGSGNEVIKLEAHSRCTRKPWGHQALSLCLSQLASHLNTSGDSKSWDENYEKFKITKFVFLITSPHPLTVDW